MTTLRIGARPLPFEGHGLYFDGEASMPQKATLRMDEEAGKLLIGLPGGAETAWPLRDIRQLRDQSTDDMMLLRLASDATARLILTNSEDQRILRARAPRLRVAPPVPGKGRLAVWGAAAVGAVGLMIFVLIPLLANSLAGLIPDEGKRALGETVFEDVRVALNRTGIDPVPLCEAPDGIAALEAMSARLFPDLEGRDDISLYVLDHEMVNAFALPGGIVVLMRGLIDAAEGPDEVAAVYAHEVGHVVARDPSRIALRTAGSFGVLGLLFGDFAGGAVVLFLSNQLIQADYSQEAEANADTFAHLALLAADVRPDALAGFFVRMQEKLGETHGFVEHFMAHPALGDRIEAARRATLGDRDYRPALNAEDWAALQAICSMP